MDFELYYREHPDSAPKIGVRGFSKYYEEEEASVTYLVPEDDCLHSTNSDINYESSFDRHLTKIFLQTYSKFWKESDSSDMIGADTLDVEHLQLLPGLIWGYDLQGREWRKN